MRCLAAAFVFVLEVPAARGAEPSRAAVEVAGLLPGTYLSRDAAGSLRFAVAAVPKSRLADGAAVFYAEAARTARPFAPFFQRFLRLEDDGVRLSLRVYEPRDLAGVRGKWREPESLALFTARDVRERPDCRITLTKSPAGHWTGGTAGATCLSAVASAPLAVTMSLSPQTLEWREEGRGAAGKTVYGPFGEITLYAREREGAAPAPPAAAPAAGGAGREGGSSSKVNEAAALAPAALEVTRPSSPSKKYSMAELRSDAGADRVSLEKLVAPQPPGETTAAIVVVMSRNGSLSVFSFAEISSFDGPSLDVSGATPRLVAPGGRGLKDVVSVELRVLAPAK